jgi:hypothetical protein
MSALIRTAPTPLTNPEVSLMLQWLDAIAADETAGAAATKNAATPSRSRRPR